MADLPLQPIVAPIGWSRCGRPAVQSLVHGRVEEEEDSDHGRVADECKKVSASDAGRPCDREHDPGRGKGSDLDRAKNRAPATVKVLLNPKPERTIERELRGQFEDVRELRRSRDKVDLSEQPLGAPLRRTTLQVSTTIRHANCLAGKHSASAASSHAFSHSLAP